MSFIPEEQPLFAFLGDKTIPGRYLYLQERKSLLLGEQIIFFNS